MKKLFLIIALGILLQSCSPRINSHLSGIHYSPIDHKNDIYVMEVDEKIPEDSQFIGDLKIGDSGFSNNCGYSKVIEEAKKMARVSGANIILLTKVKKPNLGSTCYRIKAKMYRNLEESVLVEIERNIYLKNKSRLPDNADYAVVHFYRPRYFTGSAIGYKIKHNDKNSIGRIRNGSYFEYKIKDFGEHKFIAKTEAETSVTLNIEKGKEYFIRCGIKMGVIVARPEMYKIENRIAIDELKEMK